MSRRKSVIRCRDPSPEPSLSPPVFDGDGIFICSAPDSHSTDEFKTPPEESRRSCSEEAPPLNLHHPRGGDSEGPAIETPAFGTDSPETVEMLSDGHVRVNEVTNVKLDLFRIGQKRGLSVEEHSPSKRIKVKVDRQIKIGVIMSMDGETEELGSGTEVTETDATEACKDTEEDGVNNGGTLNLQQEQEEKDEEEATETIVDDAEDLSKQGRRSLPPSWGIQTEGKGVDKKKTSNAEEGASSGNVDVVMEVLRWLADEERQKNKKSDHDNDAPVDFLETVRRRGVVFPEPKWWHVKEE